MTNMKLCLVLVLVCALFTTAAAQDSTTAKATLTITANATGERVRITAPSSVVQMHVEVYAASGEKLFDQEIRGGNVFDWHLQDGQAQRLAPGAYVCVVTAKSVSGKITQKLGTVTVAEKSASVQAGSLQLSLQQTQAIGPVEADSSWTIAGENEPQTPTVIANDGKEGQMIRGRGALTFRIGNFFSGIDTEQMRLTEAGDLGIGTSQPQSKLDVAGTIRAQRFLVTRPNLSSSDKTAAATQATDGADSVQPLIAGTGTQNQIARWTDNAGTLGDSNITQQAGSGFIGIGTATPSSLGFSRILQIDGAYPGVVLNSISSGGRKFTIGSNTYAGVGWLDFYDETAAASRMVISPTGNVGIGMTGALPALPSSPGGFTRILQVDGVYPGVVLNSTSSGGRKFTIGSNAFAGAGWLDFYDETASASRMVIIPSGNVGIGTRAPATPLEVNGLLRSTRTGIAGQYLQLNGGDSGSIKLTAQSILDAEKPLLIQNLSGQATPGVLNSIQFQLGTGAAPSTKMIIDKDGNVGIGTTPTRGKLEINGVHAPFSQNISGYFMDNLGVSTFNISEVENVSLYASNGILATAFGAFSDGRIKRIHGRSDAARDLATLAGIEVTDYSFIDTAARGSGKHKKVIAQQVEKLFPQAVQRTTDVVPDIYQKAEVKAGWVQLATNLKKGERIRLIGAHKEGIYEVLEVEQDKFRTDFGADGDVVFVYGREVKDFRVVDYDAITTLNVSATQELNRLMEKKDAEITAIKAENEALNARLAALEQMMQQATGQQGQAQSKRQR